MTATVLGTLGVLTPGTAQAYVRYLAKNGSAYSWATSCVRLVAYPQEVPSATVRLTVDQVTTAVTQAASAWSGQDPMLGGCSYLDLQLTMAPVTQALPDAKYDHYNNIVFRSDGWSTLCSPSPTGALVCHDPSALAITSVFAKGTGEIVDTDIEVNAVNFHWADLVSTPPTPGSRDQDLQNALTHEMGHLIGLDHTCYIYSSGGADDPAHPRPKDQTGQLIPDCNNASVEVQATTMFASADPGDVSKRTLEPDDLEAICAVYPRSSDPMSCAAPYDEQALCEATPRAATTTSCPASNQGGGQGCSIAPGVSGLAVVDGAESRSSPLVVVGTALALAITIRRRRGPRLR